MCHRRIDNHQDSHTCSCFSYSSNYHQATKTTIYTKAEKQKTKQKHDHINLSTSKFCENKIKRYPSLICELLFHPAWNELVRFASETQMSDIRWRISSRKEQITNVYAVLEQSCSGTDYVHLPKYRLIVTTPSLPTEASTANTLHTGARCLCQRQLLFGETHKPQLHQASCSQLLISLLGTLRPVFSPDWEQKTNLIPSSPWSSFLGKREGREKSKFCQKSYDFV